MGNLIVFLILAVIAIGSAVLMLTSRNAVHSALWLIVNFAIIAVFYIILNAPFLAMVQITVYAGAIMVLFLFVIMLLGAELGAGVLSTKRGQLWTALGLGAIVIASIAGALGRMATSPVATQAADTRPRTLAIIMFENYTFPFEVTGILLLVAVVGLYVMSKQLRKGA